MRVESTGRFLSRVQRLQPAATLREKTWSVSYLLKPLKRGSGLRSSRHSQRREWAVGGGEHLRDGQICFNVFLGGKFRVSPAILKTFYSGTIESVLTKCISVWCGNASNQDCKALQRVVCLAELISGSALPSLQDIYLKRCKSRAVKIIKDSNHPGNSPFILLPSGKHVRSIMAKNWET